MKTIGLMGGMSWESTIEYYRIINEDVRASFGGHVSAKILLYSFNFDEILKLNWDIAPLSQKLINAAQTLEKAGSDCVVICTNTMHLLADEIQAKISIPLLSIVDATAQEIKSKSIDSVGLLGTKLTMEKDFYKSKLKDNYGVNVLIPEQSDRNAVHEIIFGELCKGRNDIDSRNRLLEITGKLVKSGAKGIILGCTELPLIMNQSEVSVPLFDTTKLHSKMAAKFSMV